MRKGNGLHIELIKGSRGVYTLKAGFDDHTTACHSIADPFSDQLKGAWFCLQNGLLNPKQDPEEIPCCYPLDGQGKVVKCQKLYLTYMKKE